MEEKTVKILIASAFGILAGAFLKSAFDDAKTQAEDEANPPVRWTDAARWE